MELDAQSQILLDNINRSGVLPLSQFSPVQAREQLLKLRPSRPAVHTHEMWRVSDETLQTPDGRFRIRMFGPRPPLPGELMPAVLYFHGGGFFAGGLEETDLTVRQIASQADVVVFNIDYHLAPEDPFPIAVNDAYAALVWVAEHAQSFNIDPTRLMLAGDSAGGNLVIATCLRVREEGGPPIRFQVPIYPSLDLRSCASYESRRAWGQGGYFLSNDDIRWMVASYVTTTEAANDWRASPIVAHSYAGLPEALVVTASHDPLVDEGKLYADRLRSDGVTTEYVCFDGTIHGFVTLALFLDVGKRAMDLICERIKGVGWR